MKTIITAALFLFAMAMNSQTFEISGKILNLENIPTTVSLFESTKSSLVKLCISDAKGNFKYKEVTAGSYFITISGDKIEDFKTIIFEISTQNLVLEPFILSKKATQLQEITVAAKKKPTVEVFADKTVFNVQNSLSAIGVSAFETLRKAPGIVINNNDDLIVEGKTGVQIYIDGKPSVLSGIDLTNYLKTIQASDIDLIEIITNPSSKFEAAGNAGIVNIKLKKDKRFGTNGSLGLGFAVGKFSRYNSSLSLNNRTKKTNLFMNYSNSFNKSFSFFNQNRTQSNTIFDSKNTYVYNENNNNLKVGVDYLINKKNTLGVVVNSNFKTDYSNANTRTPITTIGNLLPNQVLTSQSNDKSSTVNVRSNLNYRFADTLGHMISTDFDFGKYNYQRNNFQPNLYFNGTETVLQNQFIYKMNTPIDINILSLKTDYEQNLWKGKLGVGFKVSQVNTKNSFDFFDVLNNQDVLNLARSNAFKYKEDINALYFNYSNKYKKFEYQFGLRTEQTISKGDLISNQLNINNTVERNYTNYFPSAGLTFKANGNATWALNYSKRIERPNYRALNPFESQLDELSLSRGNPFLQPQYTNSFKISNSYKYVLNTSFSYSFIKDFFAQVTSAEGLNRSVFTTKNVANQAVYNFDVSYSFSIKKWWEIYANTQFSNSSYQGNDVNFVSITQNNFNCYASNTFSVPSKIKIEVSGWFSSPSVWGGTYRTISLGSLDLAFQKKILKDKLTLRVAFSDIFYTSNWQGDTKFGDLSIDASGGNDSRQVRINLSYNFGNSNVKSTVKKSSIDEENKRI